MGSRKLNPRLAKIHRNYTVEEVANLYGIHRNTVRQWIKQGLPVIDDKRPALILGRDLFSFIDVKRKKNKRRCPDGYLYCLRCREPRRPINDSAIYVPATECNGNLIANCSQCETTMYRRVNAARLDAVRGDIEIRAAKSPSRICAHD